MEIGSALLEDWMRDHYKDASVDIGSSGVEDYSLLDLRRLTGLNLTAFDDMVFRDSPCTGREDLRKAIADRWGTGDPETVTTTHGASEAIYAALVTILSPTNDVVVLDPAYHSLVSIPRSLGCAIQSWRLQPDCAFRPSLDELEVLTADRDHRITAIVVNFPHNPTGATLTEDELYRLVQVARRADAHLLWDASFNELVYDRPPLPDPIRCYPKAISVGTFSKCFGLPGLRFGWCMADPEVIRRITYLRDQVTLSLSQLTEAIALHVVRHADDLIAPRLKQAAQNRRLLGEWVKQYEAYVDLPSLPQGGVTAFPKLRGHADTRDLCARLSEHHKVLLVPGAAFGCPDRVRLGFGGSTGQFTKGLDHLGQTLGGA